MVNFGVQLAKIGFELKRQDLNDSAGGKPESLTIAILGAKPSLHKVGSAAVVVENRKPLLNHAQLLSMCNSCIDVRNIIYCTETFNFSTAKYRVCTYY